MSEQAHSEQSGIELIAAERDRQELEERWTHTHDDQHGHGELRQAAKAYASDPGENTPAPAYWPWEADWWKPGHDPIRNLVKAGALIAAEIDRLQRAEVRQGPVCDG